MLQHVTSGGRGDQDNRGRQCRAGQAGQTGILEPETIRSQSESSEAVFGSWTRAGHGGPGTLKDWHAGNGSRRKPEHKRGSAQATQAERVKQPSLVSGRGNMYPRAVKRKWRARTRTGDAGPGQPLRRRGYGNGTDQRGQRKWMERTRPGDAG